VFEENVRTTSFCTALRVSLGRSEKFASSKYFVRVDSRLYGEYRRFSQEKVRAQQIIESVLIRANSGAKLQEQMYRAFGVPALELGSVGSLEPMLSLVFTNLPALDQIDSLFFFSSLFSSFLAGGRGIPGIGVEIFYTTLLEVGKPSIEGALLLTPALSSSFPAFFP
jgi:hypothetical protein